MPTDASQGDVTRLLRQAGQGDQKPLNALIPLVYNELRRLAGAHLRPERTGHSLRPTELVHETYLRMVVQTRARPRDRAHFFSLASQAMRRILVDHARRHAAAKRPGVHGKVNLDAAPEQAIEANQALLELEEALCRLTELDPRQARVVELRYFGGMTVEETALVLGVSEATVAREWRAARAWLYRDLSRSRGGDGHGVGDPGPLPQSS